MLLFTPGPTPVLEAVRQAMATATIHHRTPEFEAIFKEAREGLIELFGMDEAIMLGSTGTGAMQACVMNLCHKKALTINSGKFGERFGKIADALNLPKKELVYEWNTPASLKDIEETLKEDTLIDAIFIQVSESSGGLRHPVEEIAKKVKEINEDIIVVADAITALGVEKIDTTNIDALISGSQKALMLPPGLAMIGLSNSAIKKIGNGKDYYFNLASEIKKQQQNTTAYTATTTLIIGLNAMIKEVKENGGWDKLFKETNLRAKATKEALKSIGLNIYPKTPALSMTTIIDENAEDIRKILKNEFNVNLAGGQDHLKGKIFRINQMGLIPIYESSWVVNSIELAMDSLGKREFDGMANRVFNEIYFERKK